MSIQQPKQLRQDDSSWEPNPLQQTFAQWSSCEQEFLTALRNAEDSEPAAASEFESRERLQFAACMLRTGVCQSPVRALEIAARHWQTQNEWWDQALNIRGRPRMPPPAAELQRQRERDPVLLNGIVMPVKLPRPAATVEPQPLSPEQQADLEAQQRREEAVARELARIAKLPPPSVRRSVVQLANADCLSEMQALQGNARAQIVLATDDLQRFNAQWESQLRALTSNFGRHAKRVRKVRAELLEIHRRVGAIRQLLVQRGVLQNVERDPEAESSDDEREPKQEALAVAEAAADAGQTPVGTGDTDHSAQAEKEPQAEAPPPPEPPHE